MKAVVFKKYGPADVLHLAEIDKPEPKNNEILLKIKATAVNSGDWRLRKADPFAVRLFLGLTKPKINVLGAVFSGEVERVGKDVTLFKKGDHLFGHTDMSFGTYAEYKSIPQNGSLALKPQSLSHQEAAVIPFGGTTALHFIKKAKIKKGQKVLINGASGAVGSAALQLAKYFGAYVVAVCSSSNTDLVKSLGADEVIDYNKQQVLTGIPTYDVVFDTVNKLPFSICMKSIKENGVLILSSAGMSNILRGAWKSSTGNKKVLTGVIKHDAGAINFLKDLIEIGKYKPVVDRTFLMGEMAAAHAYAEKGHKKGNVAITIE
jgi:NADPH:quinone reductase-like Zn-dependent oxidoreductase